MVKNNTNQTKPNPSLGLYNETTNFPSSFRPYIELNSQFLSFLTSKIQKKIFLGQFRLFEGVVFFEKTHKVDVSANFEGSYNFIRPAEHEI